MQGKTILVTGSTDGIGKQTALELACMGAHVIVHGRSLARAQAALEEIRQAVERTCGEPALDILIADFSSLEQVRQMAAQVQERFPRLDVLVNNAGVFMKRRQLTPQGLEYTLVINHLAHFLLTHLLLDVLKRSAPARILNVSSNTHQWVTDVDFDNLQGERHYDGDDAYALSKLANIWFTVELAERLQGSGVTVNALHPGVINTKLLRTGFVAPGAEVSEGAETSVYLACAPQVEGVSGAYFVQKQRSGTSALSRDRELRQRFWQVSAALVGL